MAPIMHAAHQGMVERIFANKVCALRLYLESKKKNLPYSENAFFLEWEETKARIYEELRTECFHRGFPQGYFKPDQLDMMVAGTLQDLREKNEVALKAKIDELLTKKESEYGSLQSSTGTSSQSLPPCEVPTFSLVVVAPRSKRPPPFSSWEFRCLVKLNRPVCDSVLP
jgi:hypothetical protein